MGGVSYSDNPVEIAGALMGATYGRNGTGNFNDGIRSVSRGTKFRI